VKIVILGGGPAGLYAGLLIKKADPRHEITLIERNPAGVTYGWGVVFSDRTLAAFQRADARTYEQITGQFVIWDAIDVRYRGATIRCGGHVIASISRRHLLNILQDRCAALGVDLQFGREVHSLADLPDADLLIAADGVNSLVRREYEAAFEPQIRLGKARYIWLGAEKVLDAFTFIFHETPAGLFQVHAYPFSGTTSTFIVECAEEVWRRAGLDEADETASLAFCQALLAEDLGGIPLLSNNSKWISFPTLKTRHWHTTLSTQRSALSTPVVLLGDAVHTAHFSIGSGTKLAMEDAIALAAALEQHADVGTALTAYELERKPVVEIFQNAGRDSQTYFETLARYLALPPIPFAFQLLTRSGRITYDDLHFRDARFGDLVDRGWAGVGGRGVGVGDAGSGIRDPRSGIGSLPLVAAPPLLAPLELRGMRLANRVGVSPLSSCPAQEGAPGAEYANVIARAAGSGAGLVLTEPVAVIGEGRITPGDLGLYTPEQGAAWGRMVAAVHGTGAKIGLVLNHAGRRGATRPRSEGLDRPLRAGGWPLLAPSALPYTPPSQVPGAMNQADRDAVGAAFVRAAEWGREAGFDLLQLHMAHGYLLGSFLSPLTNQRTDEYGGDLEARQRWPLEVFDAVRAAWPAGKPLAVALTTTDSVRGGFGVDDAVAVARTLKAHGCDLITVLAGHTVPDAEMPYGRGFLTPLSDRLRNEAGVPTLVGGYLTTQNEVNTIIAAARADLCVMEWA
jgi:anthraniloyl-CoA monooxygenase